MTGCHSGQVELDDANERPEYPMHARTFTQCTTSESASCPVLKATTVGGAKFPP